MAQETVDTVFQHLRFTTVNPRRFAATFPKVAPSQTCRLEEDVYHCFPNPGSAFTHLYTYGSPFESLHETPCTIPLRLAQEGEQAAHDMFGIVSYLNLTLGALHSLWSQIPVESSQTLPDAQLLSLNLLDCESRFFPRYHIFSLVLHPAAERCFPDPDPGSLLLSSVT